MGSISVRAIGIILLMHLSQADPYRSAQQPHAVRRAVLAQLEHLGRESAHLLLAHLLLGCLLLWYRLRRFIRFLHT